MSPRTIKNKLHLCFQNFPKLPEILENFENTRAINP